MRAPRKTAALVAAAVVSITGASTAIAYWTTTGSGTGTADTGTSVNWIVTTDAAQGGPLTPGGPKQTIAFHVKNDSTGVQNLSKTTVAVADDKGVSWDNGAGCSAADYTVDVTTDPTFGDVAAGATVDGIITITMNNLASNQDGCKNVTVPLYVHAE